MYECFSVYFKKTISFISSLVLANARWKGNLFWNPWYHGYQSIWLNYPQVHFLSDVDIIIKRAFICSFEENNWFHRLYLWSLVKPDLDMDMYCEIFAVILIFLQYVSFSLDRIKVANVSSRISLIPKLFSMYY